MSFDLIIDAVVAAARATSVSGWIATVTAVIYVILAAKEKTLCWPFGIISSVFSVIVYLESQLPFESLLNVFYVFAGIYGWWKWSRKNDTDKNLYSPVIRLDLKTGLILLATGIAGSVITGAISKYYQTSVFPWADASITVFSILATWMTAKKIIENWLLWIVVDLSAVFIYILKGPSMYLFAILFILYTFMAIAGYFAWKKTLSQQSNA